MVERSRQTAAEDRAAGRQGTTPAATPIAYDDREDDFEALVLKSLPHLRAFAMTLARDRTWADDLVQDAVMKALAAEDSFQRGTNFRAWIFTILRNHYLNEVRRPRYRDAPIEETSEAALAVAPRQESRADMSDLRRALDELSDEHREIIVLIGINGFSYQEAAAICGCAVGTVRSRLSRAREELRRHLGK
jgi:RNA polymerase sigma-70 factor (ECF subfamily)